MKNKEKKKLTIRKKILIGIVVIVVLIILIPILLDTKVNPKNSNKKTISSQNNHTHLNNFSTEKQFIIIANQYANKKINDQILKKKVNKLLPYFRFYNWKVKLKNFKITTNKKLYFFRGQLNNSKIFFVSSILKEKNSKLIRLLKKNIGKTIYLYGSFVTNKNKTRLLYQDEKDNPIKNQYRINIRNIVFNNVNSKTIKKMKGISHLKKHISKEQKFLNIIDKYSIEAISATDLKQVTLLKNRKNELLKLLPSNNFMNWTGYLKNIIKLDDGSYSAIIQLKSSVVDLAYNFDTENKNFKLFSSMDSYDAITFSGYFIGNQGKETIFDALEMTPQKALMNPMFLVNISKIKKR